ncbi:hypothetical protein [Halomonas sp. 707D4]|uniref:hypothetical protein n=1 Tax=Halomonas sp. 707D4 TaxID=1904455 RepID=UPI00209EB136|nr:hypothetical protein [Halomonas sp. 707D4]MCP1327540.1 hypothetical protein [Halomonas sp. 707D4]
MLSALIYVLIFVGVTATLYQLYAVNYAINFDNHKRLSRDQAERLETLKHAGAEYRASGERAPFEQVVRSTLGEQVETALVREALEHDDEQAIKALLRRRPRLRFGERVTVRHPLLGETRLPRRDWRSLFIGLVILNSLIAQFLGGMSIYTLLYRVETPSLAWLNEPSILMVLIFLLIPLTHAIGRLDFYMNDLYQVGRLERETAAVEAYS